MLKSFDLTDRDVEMINQLKVVTGAGSAREIIRRSIEEYHKKIFANKSPFGENNTPPLKPNKQPKTTIKQQQTTTKQRKQK